MKFGLKEKNIEQITGVFSHYPEVKKVILYGSRAKGNYKDGSDIDLTLEGRDLSLSILHQIDNEIDDLLLPYTFDLSLFKQIDNPDLIDHIKSVGILFYEGEIKRFQLTKEVSEAMIAHAKADDPNECCGLLAGKNQVATEIYQISNLPSDDPSIIDLNVPADRRLRYVMAPKEQIAAFKQMRENETEFLAIYHSHTHSPAWPSETDTRLAFYPDVHYLIISLENKASPLIRAFTIISGEIAEREIKIV